VLLEPRCETFFCVFFDVTCLEFFEGDAHVKASINVMDP
jgi:hypothetical protein